MGEVHQHKIQAGYEGHGHFRFPRKTNPVVRTGRSFDGSDPCGPKNHAGVKRVSSAGRW
nr:MAG TPA: hypothetical protein [Caudoviricetes sp.]